MSQSESQAIPAAGAAGGVEANVPAGGGGGTPSPGGPRSFFRRVLDWYSCRPERERVKGTAVLSPREQELLGRAKAALATGNFLGEPSDPSRRGLATGHAASLYSEALVWALWSHAASQTEPNLDALWGDGSPVVREVAFSPERVVEVEKLLHTPRLGVALADRPESERDAAATVLKRTALAVIDLREKSVRALDALAFKAFARIVLTLLVVGGLVGGIVAMRPPKVNLAAGKPWKASSAMFECHPAQTECGGAKTRILFHTRDELNPWFEYDFGARMEFSSLLVENRQDAEGERAVPLIAEVGDDGEHFREVARRDSDFSTWKPSFPKVAARFVRLRVPRRSMLHLENVEVYK
jgi:hypothetical protein